ncbi:MAG: peptidylprolyl isomerase [Candidatus Moraniibacteriota bacterium]|jgi:PPIC-type peptidyl-prolyl cis-trans isomerase-like protein
MKKNIKKISIIAVAVIVVSFMSMLVFTYVFRIESPAITSVRKSLNLPAIIVEGDWITISELDENTASIKRFYENQDFSQFGIRIDFDTEDGKKRLKLQERKMINKLVEDIAIERMADEWKINISDEAVIAAMERPMSDMGTKDVVAQRLDNLYGWSLNDFGKKVVFGQLLREKVTTRFEKENIVTDDMREKIQEAKKELDDGRIFADVAMKFSEGATASEGGIVGWFTDGLLQDKIGKKVLTMDKGDYTDVIETPLGLHLVKVNEVAETEDGKKIAHVSQIVIKKKTFVDYLNDEISMMDVKIFIPGYAWNSEKAMIIFAGDDMIQFEQEKIEEAKDVKKELLENK